MIKAVFFDLGDTLVVERNDSRHIWEGKLKKLPHVEAILRELKQQYKLGIITNTVTSRKEHVRMALRKIGIAQYFDVIITSVDTGYEKPNERIFFAALEALNVQSKEAVMVGNRITKDILGGNKAGMKTILYRWNDRYPERVASPLEQPICTIQSLKELPSILSKI